MTHSPVTWEAPDKGLWERDTAHTSTVTAVPMRAMMEQRLAEGFRRSFLPLGVPLSHVQTRYVNGWSYTSAFMHDVPRGPGKPPPKIVLKVLSRLHPGFRRRTKIAATAIAAGLPQRIAQTWAGERESWIQRFIELQRVDMDRLDDEQLAEHLAAVIEASGEGLQRHFELVTGCIPLGLWLARCDTWGLPRDLARRAVMHSTPVHVEASLRLERIVAALVGASAADLDGIRGHSAEAAAALDDYIEHHGWWGTEDSIECSRVIDHPGIVLGVIRATRPGTAAAHGDAAAALLAELRSRVPANDHAEFDRMATEAHQSHQLLDDNSGILGSWGAGVAGAVYRAAGRRLVQRGLIRDVDDVWAITTENAVSLLAGRSTLTISDVDAAVSLLKAQARLSPPKSLNGEPSPPPDASVFPEPVALLMTGIGTYLGDKFGDAGGASGIGTRTVTGRAVLALSASDAFDRLEPGDILVTTATTPSYNAVLPLVGGLVVTEGGPSCHAAIMARELDVPAIVGLVDALSTIPDGAIITLDPANARVILGASV